MGCVNIKDQIENEMLKIKMNRIEVQYERQQQLKLLKEKYGYDYKPSTIPDYYDPNTTKENQPQKKRSFSLNKKSKTIRLKPKRSKSISIHAKKSISSKDTNANIKIKIKNKDKNSVIKKKKIKLKGRKTLKF